MDSTNSPDQSDDSEQIEPSDSVDARQDAFRKDHAYLTPAMQAFAEHWAINRNQTKAYQHAYPTSGEKHAKDNARHLIRDPRVQSEIRRIVERWTDHSVIEISRLERELSRIATSDARALFDKDGDLLPPHKWDADLAACVSSVKTSTTVGKNGDVTTHRTVRLWDKHAAARTLLEAKGAFQKNKPPPGVLASFNFTFAGGQAPAGMPPGMTVDVGSGSAVLEPHRRPKTSANRALQAPQSRPSKVKTRRKGAKSPIKPVEISTVAHPDVPRTVSDDIPTAPKPKALFGDAA